MKNVDIKTVEGFGQEWKSFNQVDLTEHEKNQIFQDYFNIFPKEFLSKKMTGVDVGCGSGRWATIVAPLVGTLHLVDASKEALDVAKNNMKSHSNCVFHNASVDGLPFEDNTLDFAYSLGVLHHVPDTGAAINSIVKKLKPNSPLLLYLYYAFDNRSLWFKLIWKCSNLFRIVISRTPFVIRHKICQIIAMLVYWPLARTSKLLDYMGISTSSIPLSYYKDKSFYTMSTDSLDRFGTRLEQRFTRVQIEKMMKDAGIKDIRFSDSTPYWCVVGTKSPV